MEHFSQSRRLGGLRMGVLAVSCRAKLIEKDHLMLIDVHSPLVSIASRVTFQGTPPLVPELGTLHKPTHSK